MTTEQFCWWLQGFFELTDTRHLSESQVQIIKDHLNLVFNKVTPKRDSGGGLPNPVFPPFQPIQPIDRQRWLDKLGTMPKDWTQTVIC